MHVFMMCQIAANVKLDYFTYQIKSSGRLLNAVIL